MLATQTATTRAGDISEPQPKPSEGDEPYDPGEGDEPYDPEDVIETDIKGPDTGTKDAAKQSTGEEPYDPEDEFVLDLIEDISLPSALKKIDKPNLCTLVKLLLCAQLFM